jgi:ergothioneine biosynthesis protein EgtB
MAMALSAALPAGSHDIAPKMDLRALYRAVRQTSERLCEPLETEDYVVQSMPDASPIKWHLAHTTWFFETFLLVPHSPGYRPFHPQFGFLFNSYYEALGPRWPRADRGLMVRPTVAEIFRYRAHVDKSMEDFLSKAEPLRPLVLLGLNHEQQHQELMVTDLKHAWMANLLQPVFGPTRPKRGSPPPLQWHVQAGGLVDMGHDGADFAFDNEGPRHRVFQQPYRLANRLVTCGEYRQFIDDGGYLRPELWLSDGWAVRQSRHWTCPLYWEKDKDGWRIRTLLGQRSIDADEPVCHVSYYEADAFARWADARLPSESEWEAVAGQRPMAGHFLESGHLHPMADCAADDTGTVVQMFGDVWQWTASSYSAYPGYRPSAGALGEYNGKFMCNQFVLRGASCATPRSHARRTYRNFFPPDARWQFTGIRLAKEPS